MNPLKILRDKSRMQILTIRATFLFLGDFFLCSFGYNLPMAKVWTFIKQHIVSVTLLFLGLLFITLKIPNIIKWDWWVVLIPFYAFAAYWAALIAIGAYLTKKEEREQQGGNHE